MSSLSEETNLVGFDWNIWKAADALEEKAIDKSFYPDLTRRVVRILRQEWSQFVGRPEWRSLLDKRTLQYELEECIVAIALYEETIAPHMQHIAVDVCAGKGLYSFLLSYLRPPYLASIVMIEQAAVHWHHIRVANKRQDGRPRIQIWEKTNLHEYDKVLSRLIELPHPLIMTGIHLCKQLSPAFCGLVNGLGDKCLVSCLAPCCLPRVVNSQGKIQNDKEEKFKDRFVNHGTKCTSTTYVGGDACLQPSKHQHLRRHYVRSRKGRPVKPIFSPNVNSMWCYLCHDPRHSIDRCSMLNHMSDDRQQVVLQSACSASFLQDCPIAMIRASPHTEGPPLLALDLSQMFLETANGITSPFEGFCRLLSTSLQDRSLVQIVDAPLKQSSVHHQDDCNWNQNRKSLFILAGQFKRGNVTIQG
jgi:hypothetical protein